MVRRKNNMWISLTVLGISACIFCGCGGKQSTSNNSDATESTGNIVTQTNKSPIVFATENNIKEIASKDGNMMIDVTDFLTKEGADILRECIIKEYQIEDEGMLTVCIVDRPENDFDAIDDFYAKHQFKSYSRDDLYNMMCIHEAFIKKIHPEYKPVSDELFKERVKEVFGITDMNDPTFRKSQNVMNDSCFFIYLWGYAVDNGLFEPGVYLGENTEINNIEHYDSSTQEYYFYLDTKMVFPHRPSAEHCRFDVMDPWEDGWGHKYDSEKITDLRNILTIREPLYEKCRTQGRIWIDKEYIDFVFHYNNYIFYQNKASLNWLIAKYPYTVEIIFGHFNYDKDEVLNKYICKQVKTAAFKDNEYVGLSEYSLFNFYGHDVYGNWVLREGLLKTMADNAYDPKEKDEYGLQGCKLMQHLQEYIQFPSYDEKISSDRSFLRPLTFAYYTDKAYNNFVEQSGQEPNCWIDHFGLALYDVENDCESALYKKIKKDNFYDNEEFKDLCLRRYNINREKSLEKSLKYKMMNGDS